MCPKSYNSTIAILVYSCYPFTHSRTHNMHMCRDRRKKTYTHIHTTAVNIDTNVACWLRQVLLYATNSRATWFWCVTNLLGAIPPPFLFHQSQYIKIRAWRTKQCYKTSLNDSTNLRKYQVPLRKKHVQSRVACIVYSYMHQQRDILLLCYSFSRVNWHTGNYYTLWSLHGFHTWLSSSLLLLHLRPRSESSYVRIMSVTGVKP